MIYYTSDLHLGHENIIKLSRRPFADVEEMDRALIDNWNSVVGDGDHIYIVGDLIYRATQGPAEYLKQLKGHKHLIVGNHDAKMLRSPDIRDYLESVDQLKEVHDNGKRIILCHYPLAEWEGFYGQAVHFYGHIHNNKDRTHEIMKEIPRAYNVGVDVLGYYPRTADEIISEKYLAE